MVSRLALQYSGWAFSGMLMDSMTKKASLPRICHTYPAMMKLDTVMPYLKGIFVISELSDTPLDLSWHQYFFIANQQVLLYQATQI